MYMLYGEWWKARARVLKYWVLVRHNRFKYAWMMFCLAWKYPGLVKLDRDYGRQQ